MLRGLRFDHMRSEGRIPFSPREKVPEGRMRGVGFITDSDSRETDPEAPRPSSGRPGHLLPGGRRDARISLCKTAQHQNAPAREREAWDAKQSVNFPRRSPRLRFLMLRCLRSQITRVGSEFPSPLGRRCPEGADEGRRSHRGVRSSRGPPRNPTTLIRPFRPPSPGGRRDSRLIPREQRNIKTCASGYYFEVSE